MDKLTLHTRKPFENQHSIENVFDAIVSDYSGLGNHLRQVTRHSKGYLNRALILWEVWRNRGAINHITGDISFAALSLPNAKSTVITFHDFLFLNRRITTRTKLLRHFWLDLPLKRAQHITAVSWYTKQKLLELKPEIASERIHVIHNPVHPIFTPRTTRPNNVVPKILLVGTNPNKNLDRIFSALEGLNCVVLVLGKLNESQAQRASGKAINYICIQDLNLQGVKEIYHQSDILLFASTDEGFGLPVIEAQACGVPVITSNTSSLPEVAGDAALFVNPYSIEEIRRSVIDLLGSQSLQNDLIVKGFQNARRFAVGNIRKQYLKLYKKIEKG